MYQFNHIEKAVADEFGVHPEWMHSPVRKKEIVQARQMAMLLMGFEHINVPVIAVFFQKDRNTVNQAVSTMSIQAQAYDDMREKAQNICQKLNFSTDDFFRFCRMVPNNLKK